MTVSTVYKLAAEMSTRGNLPAGVMAANKQLKAMQSNLGDINARVAGLGRSIGGSAFQTAAAITKGAGTAGVVAAGAGAAMMAKSGLSANAELERMTNTIAGTLQLYNHSAGAADQIGQNIKVAGQAMRDLNRIANESPGELDDVSKMFQNMLPGARSVTGDMKRIMDLTQNLALFTPTLTGGDFITSGSQMGRILTGSAGAEMDTWKRLAPVILDVGQKMKKLNGQGKVFSQSMDAGEKLTMAFNKLSGDQRMTLIEEAFKRGGPAMAAMYKNSWEGASASAISAGKRIVSAVTAPIFGKVKEALIRHTSDPNSLFGANRVERMIKVATSIGVLMAKPVEKMLEKLSQGIRYIQENTYAVVNRIYQGFQVAGAIIRGAAAFMLARMMVGAGLVAGSLAARAAGGAVRGVRGAYQMTSAGIDGVKRGAKAVKGFMDTFKSTSGISRALGFVTVLGKLGGMIGVIVPMLAFAAAAFGLLSIPLIAAAGIAAYVASKWDELSAWAVKGLNEGTITLRPLIVAALIFWERLKKMGEAFIGGQSGATLFQKAINMAASVVNGLSEGISIMARVAAGMLTIIGKLANAWDEFFGNSSDPYVQIAKRVSELQKEGMQGPDAMRRAIAEQKNGFLDKPGLGDDAIALADKLTVAAKSWKSTDISSISENAITSWTDVVTEQLKDFFGKSDDKKNKKGPMVAIQNQYLTVDLRGEDPDRSFSAFIKPLEDLAKRPTSSSADPVGGMG